MSGSLHFRTEYSSRYLFRSSQRNKKHTLFIITKEPYQIYEEIFKLTNHTATRFEGTGCYTDEKTSISAEARLVAMGTLCLSQWRMVSIIWLSSQGSVVLGSVNRTTRSPGERSV